MNSIFFHDIPEEGEGQFQSLSVDHSLNSQTSLQDNDDKALKIRSRPLLLSQPGAPQNSPTDLRNALQRRLQLHGNNNPKDWATITVPGPAVDDKETVVNLAKMCSDAYVEAPSQPNWLNTSMGFNRSDTFGWKGDGLRGHVFTDKTNETVIIAFKGTSIGIVAFPISWSCYLPTNHFNHRPPRWLVLE